jgi:D-sedoheptulose 7-phosphate isomerase
VPECVRDLPERWLYYRDMSDALGSDELAAIAASSAEIIAGLADQADQIHSICNAIVTALSDGRKVLTAGNGGSSAEAMHLAEELVGRYRGNRDPLPGLALPADSTALTCIANDFGYEHVFSRQIQALGRPGDVLVLFSTSGRGANLVNAATAAHAAGLLTICLLGRDGGDLAADADHALIVKADDTARIQEAHQVILHMILESVEQVFTPESS